MILTWKIDLFQRFFYPFSGGDTFDSCDASRKAEKSGSFQTEQLIDATSLKIVDCMINDLLQTVIRICCPSTSDAQESQAAIYSDISSDEESVSLYEPESDEHDYNDFLSESQNTKDQTNLKKKKSSNTKKNQKKNRRQRGQPIQREA